MARTFAMGRSYQAPGNSPKADGFILDFSGDAKFQAMLLRMGPLIVKRALGICRTLGEQLAHEANQAAPVGKPQKGRKGGRLAKSFGVLPRKQWQKIGLVGVAVRSSTKYHHYQEFGVDAPNRQVVLHRDDAGKKVSKGRRYRDGTQRLRDGVRVKAYRRDIIIPANPFFGEVVRRSKSSFEEQARDGMLRYIERIAATDSLSETG